MELTSREESLSAATINDLSGASFFNFLKEAMTEMGTTRSNMELDQKEENLKNKQ